MASESLSIQVVFPRFVAAKVAEGVSDKTVNTYHQHLHSISKHMVLSIPLDELTQEDSGSPDPFCPPFPFPSCPLISDCGSTCGSRIFGRFMGSLFHSVNAESA